MTPTETHKHCVFCGKSSDDVSDSICSSPLNCSPTDTVGNKYHCYPVDIKERANLAAQRARRAEPSEIKFFST